MFKTLSAASTAILLLFSLSYAQSPSVAEYETLSQTIRMDTYEGRVSSGFQIQTAERGRATITSEALQVPLRMDRPFTALGMTWQGSLGDSHQAVMEVQSSHDGQTWSDWMPVPVDHHVTLQENHYAGTLVFIPAEHGYIQYRSTVTPHITFPNPDIEQVNIAFINPGNTSQQDLHAHLQTVEHKSSPDELLREKSTGDLDFAVNTDVAYALPDYVDRQAWGSLPNAVSNRTPTSVTHLIVHHSAGQTTSNDFAAVVRSYYNYHTGPQLNWADIGYNWLVDPNGVIYQGRAFYEDSFGNINMNVVGAHMGGGNSNTMGICVIGSYSFTPPSEIAVDRLREMLAWKAHDFDIDVLVRRNKLVSGTTRSMFTISGHRDGTSTACPGDRLYDQLPEIRNRVNARLNPPAFAGVDAQVSAASPQQATVNAMIETYRADVAGFVAYGPEEDNLFMESAEFNLTGSDQLQQAVIELNELQPGVDYYYQVVAVNSDTLSLSPVGVFTAGEPTSLEDESQIPAAAQLAQNFPNPFNPSTDIRFELPESAQVRIIVHDARGQQVEVLAQGGYSAGRHQVSFNAGNLSSGLYFYGLEVNGRIVQTRKMLLLK